MQRRSKLIRFFSLFLVVLSCLSCTLLVSAEDLPVKSPGLGGGLPPVAFVAPPSSVVVSSYIYDPGADPVSFGYTLSPLLSLVPSAYFVTSNDYVTEDGLYNYSLNIEYGSFSCFDNDDYLECSVNFNVNFMIGGNTSDQSCVTISDFYTSSESSEIWGIHSDVVLSLEASGYNPERYVVKYSPLGSSDVFTYDSYTDGFNFDAVGSVLDVTPEWWGSDSGTFYIHSVDVYFPNPINFIEYGSLYYKIDPDLRSLDLDAASGSSGDEDPSPTATILSFFSDIGNWFVDFTPDIMALFYTPGVDASPGKLTLFGAIALLGLGFVLIFLLFYLVSSFLRFRN